MASGERDVSEVALKGASAPMAVAASRAAVLRRLRLTDAIFHGLTRAASLAVLALLSGVIIALIYGAAPALGTIFLDRAAVAPLGPRGEISAAGFYAGVDGPSGPECAKSFGRVSYNSRPG